MFSRFEPLLNVVLRSVTLGVRFIFIIFLAKYLDPASLGYYGLFTATVGIALFFVGFDYYTYTTRKILKLPNDQRGQLLKGQLALSGILYVGLAPIGLIIVSYLGWPKFMVLWFIPILFLEHINQELHRLLIALSEQITASCVLFLRHGSWALFIIAIMAVDADSRDLSVAFIAWSISGVIAAFLGMYKLRQTQMGGWRTPINWDWVKQGMRISLWLLVSTVALRAVQIFDRYWFEALGGIELLGAYVLLVSVAGSLIVFLDAGVFSYAYPKLIQYAHDNDKFSARQTLRKSLLQTVLVSISFAVISYTLLPHLLIWVGKPIYINALYLYPWLMSAMVFNALNLVPHYGLYALGHDRPIIISHIAALAVFVLTTWTLSHVYAVLAVPLGLNAAFLTLVLSKSGAYFSYRKP